MSKFEEFKQAFDEKFEDGIWQFMDEHEYNMDELPFGGKLIADNDKISYDSYGNEDSSLEKIIQFDDYEVLVGFFGRRQSYSGSEWEDIREVKLTEKTIKVYE